MMMRPVDPAAVIRDPHTKQPLPADGGDVPTNNFWTRRWLAGEVWRLDGDQWVRRLPTGELVSERVKTPPAADSAPVLNAPVTPLITR